MKVIIFLAFSIIGCQAVRTLRRDVRKVSHFCGHICAGCDGVGVIENDACLCYVKNYEVAEQCLIDAKRKADFFGVSWTSIQGDDHESKKTRPIRGSFLDPIIANVFENRNSQNNDFDIVNLNSMRHLNKRSIDENALLKPSKTPRILKQPIEIKERPRRRLTRSVIPNQSVYQFAIRPDAGKTLQLQIPYYEDDGVDIDHEYYYLSDDDIDECLQLAEPQWNNQLYETREVRSPWGYQATAYQNNYPYSYYI